MEFILKDFQEWSTLRPLTLTRSVADIRIGILTIHEKWNKYLGQEARISTQKYLQPLYEKSRLAKSTVIRSSLIPDENLAGAIMKLTPGSALFKEKFLLAMCSEGDPENWNADSMKPNEFTGEITNIRFPWDIFSKNQLAIEADFRLITSGRKSAPVDDVNNRINPVGNKNIFFEEGVKCTGVFLNASEGPIYIGKNAEIMEGSMIRGPFVLGNDAQLKMGTKIYGATTVGPHCKVGGEVTNSVIFGYSNKAHDGFLGNSVIGEWCNLGADTNNSNLKNNYGTVKVWSYDKEDFVSTGLQFCGLIMGDHSKSGINTMFNTGTVAGVSSNVFGGGFPEKYIRSFSWGGKDGFTGFQLDKALEVAGRVMERRKIKLSEEMKNILAYLHESGK